MAEPRYYVHRFTLAKGDILSSVGPSLKVPSFCSVAHLIANSCNMQEDILTLFDRWEELEIAFIHRLSFSRLPAGASDFQKRRLIQVSSVRDCMSKEPRFSDSHPTCDVLS